MIVFMYCIAGKRSSVRQLIYHFYLIGTLIKFGYSFLTLLYSFPNVMFTKPTC